jgi:hypothetical protein
MDAEDERQLKNETVDARRWQIAFSSSCAEDATGEKTATQNKLTALQVQQTSAKRCQPGDGLSGLRKLYTRDEYALRTMLLNADGAGDSDRAQKETKFNW